MGRRGGERLAAVIGAFTRPAAARRAWTILLALCAGPLGTAADPARSEEPIPPPAKSSPSPCARSTFRVVLDVGHTADVPGAISARGVPEFTFNLRLADDVRRALTAAGFSQTIAMVTRRPPPLGLFERAFRANKLRADLFVAIHHDSVPTRLLQNWTYAGKDEHFNDSFSGYAIFVPTVHSHAAGSLQFGKILGKELQARGLRYAHHYTLPLMGNRRRVLLDADVGVYRYNKLVVLQETRMPAVLLEAGSIINRQEALQLAGPQRRELLAAGITAAVEDFCTAQAIARSKLAAPRRTVRPAMRHRATARLPR